MYSLPYELAYSKGFSFETYGTVCQTSEAACTSSTLFTKLAPLFKTVAGRDSYMLYILWLPVAGNSCVIAVERDNVIYVLHPWLQIPAAGRSSGRVLRPRTWPQILALFLYPIADCVKWCLHELPEIFIVILILKKLFKVIIMIHSTVRRNLFVPLENIRAEKMNWQRSIVRSM